MVITASLKVQWKRRQSAAAVEDAAAPPAKSLLKNAVDPAPEPVAAQGDAAETAGGNSFCDDATETDLVYHEGR